MLPLIHFCSLAFSLISSVSVFVCVYLCEFLVLPKTCQGTDPKVVKAQSRPNVYVVDTDTPPFSSFWISEGLTLQQSACKV